MNPATAQTESQNKNEIERGAFSMFVYKQHEQTHTNTTKRNKRENQINDKLCAWINNKRKLVNRKPTIHH